MEVENLEIDFFKMIDVSRRKFPQISRDSKTIPLKWTYQLLALML